MKGGTSTFPRWDTPVVDWEEKPEPALIWQVIGGHALYWALVAAVRVGLFDALHEGPLALATLAEQLDIDPNRLGMVCDAMVAMSILDGDRAGLRLTKTSATLLVTSSDRYMGDVVVESPGIHENWPSLANTLRTGVPPYDVDADDGAFYVRFAQASFLTQLRAARFCAARIGLVGSVRLLDLGAGGGPWTIAFLEMGDSSTAVAVDLPSVIPIAQRKCAQYGVERRCEFVAGDYHDLPLEANAYDVVVLGNVLRNEGVAAATDLLGRVYAALRPGGRLLIADYFLANDHRGPLSALSLGVTMIANTKSGSVYRHLDMANWLHATGYQHLRVVETVKRSHVVVAEKPS